MNCPWLERVALAMDGDWTPEIEAHVGACGECSGLLEDREWLRSPPPLPAVAPVRKRRVTWWPAAAAIAAAAALVVSGLTLLRLPEVEPLGPVVMRHPVAPAVAVSERAIVATGSRPKRPQAVRRFDPERLAQSLIASLHRPAVPSHAVTIYTDDPEVVIMLLPSKGETEDD